MAEGVARSHLTRQQKRIIGYTGLAHALSHTPDWAYAAVLLQVGMTFGVGELVLGSIGTAYAVGYGITAVPAGWLADVAGSRRTLAFSMAGAGLLCIVVAFSQSTVMLAITMTALGLAAGMYHPVGVSLITRSVSERARALGYHGVAGNVGTVTAPAIAGALAALFSWRASFVMFGLLFLVVSMIILTAKVEEPQPGNRQRLVPSENKPRVLASLKPHLLVISLIFSINTMYGFIYRGTAVFLPAHIQNNVGETFLGFELEAIAGSLTAAALIFGSFGQLIGGHLGERFPRERLTFFLTIALGPSLFLTAFADGVVLVGAAALFIFFNFMAQPSYSALLADYTPREIQGRIFGFLFLAFFIVGSTAGVLTGWLVEQYSTDWAFVALAVVGGLVTVVAGFLALSTSGEKGRQKATNPLNLER